MKHLLALMLVLALWFNFAPSASADGNVAGLAPCSETPAFVQKSKNFRNTTADPQSGQKRAALYAQAVCGPEGYPHLIVDGRWDHIGDFFIPSILFLYITGQIGWAGRAYLIAVRDDKEAEMKEIILDVPLALKCMITAFAWPLLAIQELLTGKLTVPDSEIPVSPR
jgi:photosystem I subunit 3